MLYAKTSSKLGIFSILVIDVLYAMSCSIGMWNNEPQLLYVYDFTEPANHKF